MGRLRSRLAARRTPLGEQARQLCRLAAEAQDLQDTGALEEALEEAFSTLSAADFDDLLQATYVESQLRDDGEVLMQEVTSTAVHLSEEIVLPDEDFRAVLFAVPLVVQATRPASDLPDMSDDALQEVADLLLEHEMVSDECEVVLLPRLLSPLEADGLRLGDVYRLTRALRNEGPQAATAVVDGFREEARGGQSPLTTEFEAPRRTGGVLVGVASTTLHEVPFVLQSAEATERELIERDHEDDASAVEREEDELLEDMHAQLGDLAQELCEVLDVVDVDVTAAAGDWSSTASKAAIADRMVNGLQQIAQMAGVTAEEDLDQLAELAVLQPELSPQRMTFPVVRRSDGMAIGQLVWRELPSEDWRESLHMLLHFLADHGIEARFAGAELDDLVDSDPKSMH